MSIKQTAKVRIEIGQGIPLKLSKFDQPDVHAATLMALLRLLTGENIIAGPVGAFTARGADIRCTPR